MRFTDYLSLSTRMFKTRPMRTFLTILGVGIGIGAVLFLVSLGYGIQKVILERITTSDSLLSLSVSPGPNELVVLNKDDLSEISALDEVIEVSPVIELTSQFALDDYTGDGLILATTPAFFRLSGTKVDIGVELRNENEREMVISSAAIKLFNLELEDAIGKEIAIALFVNSMDDDGYEEIKVFERKEKYKITGIIKDESSSYAYIPISTINDIGIEKYDRAQIKISDSKLIPVSRDKIIEKGFLVSSLSDTIEQANKIFRLIQIVLALFGFVALIVSAIGMFNTMTIALLERINEIGIMRAIGVTKRDIRILFLLESVLMGFLGGIGGVLIGFAGGKLANIGINMLAKTFGGSSIDLFYSPTWFVLFIIIFSTLIGFLTGVYPSFKASRLNPLNALRYK